MSGQGKDDIVGETMHEVTGLLDDAQYPFSIQLLARVDLEESRLNLELLADTFISGLEEQFGADNRPIPKINAVTRNTSSWAFDKGALVKRPEVTTQIQIVGDDPGELAAKIPIFTPGAYVLEIRYSNGYPPH